ncbi:MAG TPA: MerC domain-containing protein [Gemmatimonadales bacterium]|nr:MerC domain-containing protein [Gemmatimonadales bacterium]
MRTSDLSSHPGALDRLGISASVLCILHCTALPIVAVALPAVGTDWALATWFGWAAVATVALVAVLTLPRGFARHRHALPGLLAVLGLLALMAGEFVAGPGLGWRAVLTLTGGLAVVAAQLHNLKLLRHCRLCGHSHCSAPIQRESAPVAE